MSVFCLASCSKTPERIDNEEAVSAIIPTETTVPETKAAATGEVTDSVTESVTAETSVGNTMEDIVISYSAEKLPDDAEKAVIRYIQSSDYDELFGSVFPMSIHDEIISKSPAANYFFGGAPFSEHSDVEITECSHMSKTQSKKIGEFLSLACQMMNVNADFTADDGYDTVITAVCTIEEYKLRVTSRVSVLHIDGEDWIVFPSSDMQTNNMEFIE